MNTNCPWFSGMRQLSEPLFSYRGPQVLQHTPDQSRAGRLLAFDLVGRHLHWPFPHPLPGFASALPPSPGMHDLATKVRILWPPV